MPISQTDSVSDFESEDAGRVGVQPYQGEESGFRRGKNTLMDMRPRT
jgi:hypothetical protein